MDKVRVLDSVSNTEPCEKCGSPLWIVDGDGRGEYWLLCYDLYREDCVNTKPIPENIEVVKD